MARGIEIKMNKGTLQEYLDGKHGVAESLRTRAERGADDMRANAPVVTGTYRDRIEVWEEHTDRLSVRYGSRSPHAHLVEAVHGTAARSLDAAGGS